MVGKVINCYQIGEQKPQVLMHIIKQADYTQFIAATLHTATLVGEQVRPQIKKITK